MRILYENGKAIIDKEEGITGAIKPLTLEEKQEIALLIKLKQQQKKEKKE